MYQTGKKHRKVRSYSTKVQKRCATVCFSEHRSAKRDKPTTHFYGKERVFYLRGKSTRYKDSWGLKFQNICLKLVRGDLRRMHSIAESIFCAKYLPRLGCEVLSWIESPDCLEGFSIEVGGVVGIS